MAAVTYLHVCRMHAHQSRHLGLFLSPGVHDVVALFQAALVDPHVGQLPKSASLKKQNSISRTGSTARGHWCPQGQGPLLEVTGVITAAFLQFCRAPEPCWKVPVFPQLCLWTSCFLHYTSLLTKVQQQHLL